MSLSKNQTEMNVCNKVLRALKEQYEDCDVNDANLKDVRILPHYFIKDVTFEEDGGLWKNMIHVKYNDDACRDQHFPIEDLKFFECDYLMRWLQRKLASCLIK